MNLRDRRPENRPGRAEQAPDPSRTARPERGTWPTGWTTGWSTSWASSSAVDDIRRQLGGKMKSHLIVEEVAEVTGKSPYTIREYIRQGRIRAIRVAGTGPRGRLLVPRRSWRSS